MGRLGSRGGAIIFIFIHSGNHQALVVGGVDIHTVRGGRGVVVVVMGLGGVTKLALFWLLWRVLNTVQILFAPHASLVIFPRVPLNKGGVLSPGCRGIGIHSRGEASRWGDSKKRPPFQRVIPNKPKGQPATGGVIDCTNRMGVVKVGSTQRNDEIRGGKTGCVFFFSRFRPVFLCGGLK